MTSPVTKSRLLAGSVLVATFLAGTMVGGATMRVFARDGAPRAERSGEERSDGERRRRHSIFDELDLSAQQRARIDSIFEQRRQQTKAFWDQHGPQMEAIVDSTRAEIDRVLTPAQLQQMQQWREERRRRHEEEEARERAEKDRTSMHPRGHFAPRPI